jgi:hypothetical protein
MLVSKCFISLLCRPLNKNIKIFHYDYSSSVLPFSSEFFFFFASGILNLLLDDIYF